MRIQKIEVVGFKSFADREVVVLDDRITGVIGPNGCGKSNIVDAMRWCLGEQSAKHLRGSGMSDVIFAGSSSRGPAGSAEVTLVFENEGDVPGVYGAYAEVSVTRRLYRDGTSEYLINKVPCRLKDIREMLMGTGIGTKGYSIIEQGRVSQIVTAKPETRRQILDEAAGITRFKAQKKAAERKISQTRQNLLRVTDVIAELESRIGTLRRQAQKAERYKRYRAEQRDLDLWAATHKFLELQSMATVLAARRTEVRERTEHLRHELQTRETSVETRRAELRELEQQLNAAKERVWQLENTLRLAEQDRKYKHEEREAVLRSRDVARKEAERVEQDVQRLVGELDGVEGRRGELSARDESEARARDLADAYEAAATALRGAQEGLRSARAELAALDSEVAGARARRTSEADRLGELEANEVNLRARRESLVREAGAADERASSVKNQVGAADVALAREHARRAELDAARARARDAVSTAEVEVETARKELLRAKSRHQSLEEIQRRYRGCASGVQVVMEHRERLAEVHADGSVSPSSPSQGIHAVHAVHGIMADFISAPERFEPAVSAMLGDRLQGVVVDDARVGASGVELLKGLQEGRTAFLPRVVPGRLARSAGSASGTGSPTAPVGWSDPTAPTSAMQVVDAADSSAPGERSHGLLERPGVLGRLTDLVTFDGAMEPLARELLGDALVVDTLGRALELWDESARAQGVTLVTVEGDRLEPSGVVVGGAPDAVDSALLQQKREIRELAEIVAQLEDEFARARSAQQAAAQALRGLEDERERNDAALLEAEKAHHSVTRDAELAASERERIGADRDRVVAEHERLLERMEAARAAIASADEVIAGADTKAPQLRDSIAGFEGSLDAHEAAREAASAALTEARVDVARFQQERKGLDETHDRIHRQLAQERGRLERLFEEGSTAESRATDLEAEIETLGREHATALSEHEAATTSKHDAREAHDAVAVAVDDLDVSIRETRRALEEERDGLSDVELGLRELELERDHLERDVRERYDDELRCVLTEFHHRAVITGAQIKRAAELKRLIGRMGEVNLTAITEYDEVSTRYEYLSGQRQDLGDAIDQLQEAIDRINATTKQRFRETFHQVNEKFQAIFPRLFNGGRAELVMTDPANLLETGVEIFAQPPGKKVASLDLLSGGEKALTAVSLIFGIFLIKPSPFCLLDEVDAPLDEANVGRFCDLVRELSDTTQFIIITHNKRTMETVDRIYGVTMQVKGISKLVSVDMRRTVSEATIH